MAVPGCPLPDFSTASMARARTVLTARRSRSDHSSSCGVWAFTACRLLLGHPFARWVGWSCACVSGAVAVLSDPRRFGTGDEVCRRGGWGACTAERRPGVLPDGIAGDDG